MRCEELKPDYILYAIGAMDEPERSELRAHLERGCQTCTEGLREAHATAYSMGAALPGPEPPRKLRERVLAISAVVAEERTLSDVSGDDAPRRAPARARRFPSLWDRPIAIWQGLALAAGCVALALIPGVALYRALSQSNAREAETARLLASERTSKASLEARLANLDRESVLRALPIFALEIVRGSAEAPKPIAIPRGAGGIVLALPEDLVRQASGIELRNASDQTIWSTTPPPAGDSDSTGVTIATQLIPPGRYSLVLHSTEQILGRLPFEVTLK